MSDISRIFYTAGTNSERDPNEVITTLLTDVIVDAIRTD